MPSKKIKPSHGTKPDLDLPKPPARATTLNLSIDPELKQAALEYIDSLGYKAAEYVAEFFEIQLTAAGKWKPKEPVIKPVPSLMRPKK